LPLDLDLDLFLPPDLGLDLLLLERDFFPERGLLERGLRVLVFFGELLVRDLAILFYNFELEKNIN